MSVTDPALLSAVRDNLPLTRIRNGRDCLLARFLMLDDHLFVKADDSLK